MIRTVAVLAMFVLAQDGVRLTAKAPAAGSKSTVGIDSVLELDILVKSKSGQEETRESSSLRSEQFAQEVTAASDGNRTIRVVCESSTLQRSGTDMPVQTVNTPLHGRTYVVAWSPSGRAVRESNGGETGADASALGAWEDFGRLLPKEEVKAGSTWTVENDDATALLAVGGISNGTATLTGTVESLDGARATLGFKGSLEGKTADGYAVKITVSSCSMTFDNTGGRPESISFKGVLEATKVVTREYIPAGSSRPRTEEVGRIEIKSKRFEVTVTHR